MMNNELESLPELPVGAKVVVGQVIARSGKTGTTGGHYGAVGYPHLHLSTRRSPKGEYQTKGSLIKTKGSYLMDPLVLYREAGPGPDKSSDPTSHKKVVTIPYMTPDGHIRPAGARVVWPVVCHP